MNIRFAIKKDIDQIITLCEAHALFEKATYNADNKSVILSEHLFNTANSTQCLVVDNGKELVGYATFMKQFSTWDAKYYMYLDCLYLTKKVRGQNIGHKIMDRIKEYAKTQNCEKIQWQTPDFNEKAIVFYKKIGASSKTKKRFSWNVNE